MRLTLRTLLAWLDDTLSPNEVRAIGRQVAESTYTQELVERINKVTRQRRLTVPPVKGPDALDPNIVAGYLDNELEPDQVAELEKRCLTSDVHLAEVASVHQILSLIGQKAKVPVDARIRMYSLVRGREAVQARVHKALHPEDVSPVSEPVQPWVTPPPPRRPLYERVWPAAAILGLIGVLCWSAYKSLEAPDSTPRVAIALAPNSDVNDLLRAAKDPKAAQSKAPNEAKNAATPEPAAPLTTPEAAPKAEEAKKPAESEKPKEGTKPEVTRTLAAGDAGLARKSFGVLLRFDSAKRDWVRLSDATPLREQDRLLSLAPFRSTLELGSGVVDLVGETEVWVRAPRPSDAARLSLAQGRVVFHGTPSGLPFEVALGDRTATITAPPNGLIGVERLNRRNYGERNPSSSILRVYASEGPVKVTQGSKTDEIAAAGALTVEPDGTFTDKSDKPAPSWVTESVLSSFEQQVGDSFLKALPTGRPIVASLVEATDDEQKDICRLAVSSLRAVGDISMVVPVLNKKRSASAATARKAAIIVLRSYLAEGPDAAKLLREQLARDFGPDLAETAEKLLVGYTPKEAEDETTLAALVGLLGRTENEVGIRELALDNLMRITGRDSLEYDPEKPDGNGLKAWRGLLRDKELKPAAKKAED